MSLIQIPEQYPDTWRVRVFMALVAFGLLGIVARLWFLQIAHGQEMWLASEANRTRNIRRVSPRGQIEDRNGVVIGTNRNQIVVSVVPEQIKKHPEALTLLASLLKKPAEDLEDVIARNKTTSFDPVRVDADVDIQTATSIEELHQEMPGISIGPEPIRHYYDGLVFGHILGQMGQIKPEELKERRDEGYRPGDFCGQIGIERAYDSDLRGTDGGREVEVDARGRIRHEVGHLDPIPGSTLRLTIDSSVQKIAYQELQSWSTRGHPGAAVAMDPQTGAVLALVSVPSFDPSQFVTGVTGKNYKQLLEDPQKPLIDRAISGGSAPGSTFKVITASAALDSGKWSPDERVFCGGSMNLGKWVKHCHKSGGHGSVNLQEAIAQSCDIYFYHVGQRLGPDLMAEYSRKYGLGTRTGVDISRENDRRLETDGAVPDPAWKLAHKKGEWVGGETVDYAIGQAMLVATPIQMCNVAAAIGNGGTLYRPQLVQMVTEYDANHHPKIVRRLKPQPIKRLEVSKATIARVARGMQAVMESGTGARSAIPGIEMAGKTGTAQVHKNGKLVNNAWFIGYAPLENPRIAVCVFIQEGGHGGEAAAPIAKKMIASYLKIPIGDVGVSPASD
jgi:penicillin-binding protein 2